MTRIGVLGTVLACLAGGMMTITMAAQTSGVETLPDGVRIATGGGFLSLHVKTDAIVRVTFSKTREFRADTMVVAGPGAGGDARLNPFTSAPETAAVVPVPKWSRTSNAATVTLTTTKLVVTVNRQDGAVRFADRSGHTVLAEVPGAHTLAPANVQGENTFHVQQRWQADANESLYGLGERQEGKLDIKGYDFDLWQRNTFVAMPVVMSSRGYGILWDNTSYTKFGDTRPFEPIPAADLVDANGIAGGLSTGALATADGPLQDAATTATLGVGRDAVVVAGPSSAAASNAEAANAGAPAPARGRGNVARGGGAGRGRGAQPAIRAWQGEIVAPVTGDYQFQTYSNGLIQFWLNGALLIDHYKQTWATENDQFKVHLDAGRHYPIKIQLSAGGNDLRVGWKTPDPSVDTSLWSEVGEGIDYYFMYGPELDDVVAGFRTITGRAPMLPKWAFGFWQSKNKYNTQDEVLGALAEFRTRQIPIDAIVQDWQYWPADAWGDHQFEASRYPNPDQTIRTIHDSHAHFMISVWGKFYPVTDNFKALDAIHGLYLTTLTEGTRDWLQRLYVFYDVFNAPARKMFWQQVNRALFSKGVDAWWMDATEPDLVQPSPPTVESLRHDIDQTAAGTASRVMSAYPLMNSEAVYDGQRATAPDQRVFILTRSGFPGIQRYATVTWSGDITSTWATLRKQITAGLGFSITGDPYWTTDTGGYTMESRFTNARDGDALDEWRELNARWYQYSTFCPILRVHGTDRPREMWNIGDESTPVYQSELNYDRLRHAMVPYTYSLAGKVTQDGYTIMRPLVMDFRGDAFAREITDEYMFGPALLISPVTEYKARTRQIYLPAGQDWYNFWTGAAAKGGTTMQADAPYSDLPVFVRAGSIVPFGSNDQYVGESSGASGTVYVYAGANGAFSLYEDDGATYGYEKAQFSTTPFAWNDRARTLTIGARSGSFPGMLSARTFNVVLVSPESAVGYPAAPARARAVSYSGGEVRVRF